MSEEIVAWCWTCRTEELSEYFDLKLRQRLPRFVPKTLPLTQEELKKHAGHEIHVPLKASKSARLK